MHKSARKRNRIGDGSNSNHSQIINDSYIKEFLKGCKFPSLNTDNEIDSNEIAVPIHPCEIGEKHILTVEGSYSLVNVKTESPSSLVAFFQFGAILFTTEDLKELSKIPFISPEDMKKLHNLQRIKLALPVKNILSNNQTSLNDSIRKAIYDFFMSEKASNVSLMETLSWIIFEEYSDSPQEIYELASNPNLNSGIGKVSLKKSQMTSKFTFQSENGEIYLTDVFRLHEVIDEDFGATGILGYIARLVEQLIIFRYLKVIYFARPAALGDFIFITNGPLSFSGQTANMHKPFRNLCNYLQKNNKLFLVGMEKSGPFVDHAISICSSDQEHVTLKKNNVLILSNDYIYRYVTPGDPNRMHYGKTSYYGGKVIIHTNDSQVYVISVPIKDADVILKPTIEDYVKLNEIINIIQLLKCDMYDDSIVPVAIASKLVSLANYQSQSILEKFAKGLV